MIDYNAEFNWFEDDTLAKDWFNDVCGHMAWKAFNNQDEWLDVEAGRIKPGAIEVFDRLFQEQTNWLKNHIVMSFMELYRDNGLEYSPEINDEVADYFGEEG